MNIPENIKMYFDYSALARDLFMNDYVFADGYVFAR
nr:MAG TPA: antirestriction protein [Caudoviricetes sp.]